MVIDLHFHRHQIVYLNNLKKHDANIDDPASIALCNTCGSFLLCHIQYQQTKHSSNTIVTGNFE